MSEQAHAKSLSLVATPCVLPGRLLGKIQICCFAVLLTGLCAIAPASAQVPPTIVARSGYDNGTPLTTHTTTAFDSTGASTLVVFVSTHTSWNGQPVSITGVTDSAGNVWKTLVGPTVYNGTTINPPPAPLLSEIFYVQAPATSTTHTVSVTLSSPAPLVMHVFAAGNSDTCSTPVSSAITNAGSTASTNVVSANINMPASSLLLSWVKNQSGATATAQDSWTLDPASVSFLWAEYMASSIAGAYYGHFLYDSAIGWQTAIVGILSTGSAPAAPNISVNTYLNTPVSVTLEATAPCSSSLTYTELTQPTHGKLTGAAPNLTYTPNDNYYGPDSFTYQAADASGNSPVATVTITVQSATDTAPVANDAKVAAAEDTPVPITLTASSANGNPLTYAVLTQPIHGTLTGTAPNLTYTPHAHYLGTDSFTFKANDGFLDSNVATATIHILQTVATIVARNGYIQGNAQTTHTTTAFDSTGASALVAFVSTNTPWDSLPVSIAGLSDSANNTWTPLVPPTFYNGASFGLLSGIYYVNAPVNSTDLTVTAMLSADAPLVMDIFAVRNSDTTGPPIVSAITDPGATVTTNVVSENITVPAGSLLLSWVKNETGATATSQDFWTLDSSSTTFLWAEYTTAAFAGVYSGHFVYSNAIGWQTAVLGIPPVAGCDLEGEHDHCCGQKSRDRDRGHDGCCSGEWGHDRSHKQQHCDDDAAGRNE